MKKIQLKNLVKKAISKQVFLYLLELKNKLSKIKHIQYSEFKMQEYLKTSSLSVQQSQFIFHSRSRMLNLADNYQGQNSDNSCPVCLNSSSKDSQLHLYQQCSELMDNTSLISDNVSYCDLFSDSDLTKQIQVASTLQQHYQKRMTILNDRDQVFTD